MGSCRGGWGFTWGSWRAGGVSHGALTGRFRFHMGCWRGGWSFTWGPAGAGGVSHGGPAGAGGVLHGGSGGAGGVSHGVSYGVLVLAGLLAVGGFLEFAVTLEPRP